MIIMSEIDRKIQWDALLKGDGLPFIKDGICVNDGTYRCELGFACDACPFNAELRGSSDEIKIDGNTVSVEEVCHIIEENKGYFDGDAFSVKPRLSISEVGK